MSGLGIGLAAVGRPAYINLGRADELPEQRPVEAMRAATFEVLDGAYAAGIRWVDTARSYGRAEEFLAEWLRAREHRDITVSSKWGYAYVADWRMDAEVHEVKEHSLAQFRRQYAQTRELLGAELALYQVHSLTADSPLFADQELLEALAELAGSGVQVGFSTSGPRQADAVRAALDIEVGGVKVFTAVQSTWNLLEPSVGPALAEAHQAGVRVLVKEALANGRLAMQPPEAVNELAARQQVGPDAIALSAVLAKPWADTVLLGAAGTRQLTANLLATEVQLDPGELSGLAEQPEQYWATRSALSWS